jgi:hypothetical protein
LFTQNETFQQPLTFYCSGSREVSKLQKQRSLQTREVDWDWAQKFPITNKTKNISDACHCSMLGFLRSRTFVN